MVSSSQATTASADVSDDDTTFSRDLRAQPGIDVSRKVTTHHEKHNKIEATVRWNHDGQMRDQTNLLFDLQYHASYNTAFFKLRAPVSAKIGLAPEQFSLFLFLAPEIVQTLSLTNDHGQALGADTVCLRFGLKAGDDALPSLVVPHIMNQSHVSWKNKHSSDTWDSLRSLARASNFDVLCRLPRRVMAEARLQSLCEALSSNRTTSTPGHFDLGGLYGGKGGKVVRFEIAVPDQPSDDALPAYQDLEPGPPMAPIQSDKASNKRRRGNSDTDDQRFSPQPKEDLTATVAWLVTELKGHKAREVLLTSELTELHSKVTMLVSQMETHRLKCTLLDDDLQDRVDGVEAKLDELAEELETRVECKVDESLDQKSEDIKEELVAYIEDTLPNKIQGALEEVTFSARF